MIEGLYEYIVNDVKREARKAQDRWRNILDADDIEQELWMFVMTRPAAQEYLLNANHSMIASALWAQADSICSKERLSLNRFQDNWHYNVAEVKSLLQRYNTSDNIPHEERFDLEESLKHLKATSPGYYSILYRRYYEGESVHDKVFRKQISRASAKLTDIMNLKKSELKNERHEGLGTAPTITDKDYY